MSSSMLPAEQAVHATINAEAQLQAQALEAYAAGMHHDWYARQIRDLGLLNLMQYASPSMLASSMYALLYAFAHPGTREGFAHLCRGLFGDDSVIIIEDSPAVVSLDVAVQNEAFYFAVAQGEFASAYGFAIAEISLTALTNDPRTFLQTFLPAGVILRRFELSLAGTAQRTIYEETKHE